MQLFSVQPLDFIEKPLEYDAVKKAVGIFLKIEGLGKIFLEYRNGMCFVVNGVKILFILPAITEKLDCCLSGDKRILW